MTLGASNARDVGSRSGTGQRAGLESNAWGVERAGAASWEAAERFESGGGRRALGVSNTQAPRPGECNAWGDAGAESWGVEFWRGGGQESCVSV